MPIGIYTNKFKDKDLSVTKTLMTLLKKNGLKYLLHKDAGGEYSVGELADKTDLLITVGGDGTILSAASVCAGRDVPILGVNLGNVGFLTEVEVGGLSECIGRLKGKDYYAEKRALLEISVADKRFTALNEAVINRDHNGKMLRLIIRGEKYVIDRCRCDGYIISTPTGSTAYSLSAGGPILSPDIDAFVLTPVCSHSLHSRPIVVSGGETLYLSLSDAVAFADETPELIADGRVVCKLTGDFTARIKKSDKACKFIRFKEASFFDRLLLKLNRWSTL